MSEGQGIAVLPLVRLTVEGARVDTIVKLAIERLFCGRRSSGSPAQSPTVVIVVSPGGIVGTSRDGLARRTLRCTQATLKQRTAAKAALLVVRRRDRLDAARRRPYGVHGGPPERARARRLPCRSSNAAYSYDFNGTEGDAADDEIWPAFDGTKAEHRKGARPVDGLRLRHLRFVTGLMSARCRAVGPRELLEIVVAVHVWRELRDHVEDLLLRRQSGLLDLFGCGHFGAPLGI